MTDGAPLLERLFTLDFSEQSYPIERIDGQVPDFVRGTYYVNGPARFGRGELRYRHWLDGDGMVAALAFSEGGVRFTNRFVRGTKLVQEEEAGRALYRTFGTAFTGDRLKHGVGIESPLNVSIWKFAGKLLAFGEQGLPYEIDPVTLETLGEYTFGGRLNGISPFSAHPCFDDSSGEMFNFGISFSAMHPLINLYRFAADGQMIYRRRLPIPYPCSVHDFCLSPRYAVVYLSPHLLDMEAIRDDGKTIMEALDWQPERGSQLLIASRETGETVASVELGSRYCLHLINSFEEGGRLTVDVVELDRPVYDQYQVIPNLFTDLLAGRPVRYVIDPATWKVLETRELKYDREPDFPAIDPRHWAQPYDHFWMLGMSKAGQRGRKFFDQLVHLSWSQESTSDIYQAPAGHYLGCEPIFIADPEDPTGGLVICKQFDAERLRDAFLLFDAHNVAAGPVATLHLKEPTPPGFHALFHPAGASDG